MTNNFEVFVQGKDRNYLVHSRMKKNHKLFVDETEEHMALVKKAIGDIISGKEPNLPESRKKEESVLGKKKTETKTTEQQKAEAEAAEAKKKEEADRIKAEMDARDAEEAEKAAAKKKEQEAAEAKKKEEAAKKKREEAEKKKKAAAAKKKAEEEAKAKAAAEAEEAAKADAAEGETTASGGSQEATPAPVEPKGEAQTGVPSKVAFEETVEDTQVNFGRQRSSEAKNEETPEAKHFTSLAEQKASIAQAATSPDPEEPKSEPQSVRTAKEEMQAQLDERAAARTAAKAEAQRTAQSSFFGFTCCRSSNIDDSIVDVPVATQVEAF